MAPKSLKKTARKSARRSARRSAKKTARKSVRRSARKTCKSGKRRSRMSGRCKISPAKKYSPKKRSPGRPKKKEAPRESAKDFPEGTLKKGNDGFYKVQVDSKGRHTWKKCSASVNGRVNCRHNRPSSDSSIFGFLDVSQPGATVGASINRRNAMVPTPVNRRNATVGTPASTPASTPTITQGLLELFQPKLVTEAPQPKSLPAPPRQLLLGAPPKQSRSMGFGTPTRPTRPTINTKNINTAREFYTPQSSSIPSVYDWEKQTPASVSNITGNPLYQGPPTSKTPKTPNFVLAENGEWVEKEKTPKQSSFFGLW